MLTNAVLTEIAAPGPADRNGDPGAPVPVWTGRAEGYLKRERRTVLSAGAMADVRRDIFWLLNNAGAPALAAAGPDWEASTVVIEDMRSGTPVPRRFTVSGFENRVTGTPVDNMRLELDAEAPA